MYRIEKDVPAPATPPIEKDIPIPPTTQPAIYPFKEMEVGDSFLVETKRHDIIKSVRSTMHWHGKKHGRKFTSRTVEGGVRIWRVK